ncbi:MAG: hypothetical protein P4L69_05520 [Desulfosporosinus sp.]|nr:hypothetical protein [Desulfosporosinus sp.]
MKYKGPAQLDCYDILCQVRTDIWEIIEKAWKEGEHFVYFVIDYDCKVSRQADKEGLCRYSQASYNAWPFRTDFECKERLIFNTVITTITKELVARFGAYFTTIHETHWASETFRFYRVVGSPPRPLSASSIDINHGDVIDVREATHECRIEFPMP